MSKKHTAPMKRQLKKGELLFKEGEGSRSMFLIQAGMLRIFKKKAEGSIEIDTIRSGQIVGELAFLDGNPRSASAEALTDTTLLEISIEAFTKTFSGMPEWLKLLLKTVVGRLRSASTRIKQLETSSTEYSFSATKGSRTAKYVYINTMDILKTCTAILLVGSRSSYDESAGGYKVRVGLVQRYANQIMGVPVAKITSVLDVLGDAKVLKIDPAGTMIHLMELELLEGFIAFINEENLLEEEKQHRLTTKSLLIMGLINRYIDRFQTDENGITTINVAEVLDMEADKKGKKPFRFDEMGELIELNYISQLNIKEKDLAVTTLHNEDFKKAYRMQRIRKGFDALNEEKSGAAAA